VTNPAEWPTDPPTEPGWYWWGPRPIGNGGITPVPVRVVRFASGELMVSDGLMAPIPFAAMPGHWRPGQIEP
jgi:hypothetical protein